MVERVWRLRGICFEGMRQYAWDGYVVYVASAIQLHVHGARIDIAPSIVLSHSKHEGRLGNHF